MHRPYSHVMKWSRTLHIYITMYAFVLMLFFALTGFILNHESWFDKGDAAVDREGKVDAKLLTEPDRLAIVELLRASYGAKGAMTTFDVEDDVLHVEFAGPGRRSEAEIDRATGALRMTLEERGWVIRMDDLHRGKNSGRAWSWIIDISAISLLLGSITGILMWVGLPRRRKLGFVALAVSLISCFGLYWLFVP